MKKSVLVISWILRILVALGFLLASLGKLTSNPQIIAMFKDWGYPEGFYFLIGIVEIIGAVLLIIPRTLKMAIYGMTVILIGAIITHLLNDPLLETLRPIIFLMMLGVVFLMNYRDNIFGPRQGKSSKNA